MRIRSSVCETPAATPEVAAAHLEDRLAFETDCSDVHADITAGVGGFTVVDCRAPELFAAGHVPGAVNLPHRRITAQSVAENLPPDGLLITYCNGFHCNASTKGALKLARLGRQVKEMRGGVEGWRLEGYALETS